MSNKEVVMEVKNLTKKFFTRKKLFAKPIPPVCAVSDVSFQLYKGETLSIVGESGCGKSTLGRCIVRAIKATEGEVIYNSGKEKVDFLSLQKEKLKEYRKDITMIFQDPHASLDQRMTVFDIIKEPLIANYNFSKTEVEDKVKEIAAKTGLNIDYLRRYPHAFSGGQRQRIGIARALITNPKVIVCDEPVSALDVSIQAQIINLLKDIQSDIGVTYIFVAHDLSVVDYISDRVAVMYLGKIIELSTTKEIFTNPKHPYTEALLSAVPTPDPDIEMNRKILDGEVPSPMNVPKGCSFHTRCPYKKDICEKEVPVFNDEEVEGHFVACHLSKELNLEGVSSGYDL